jgi:hypothetical protein
MASAAGVSATAGVTAPAAVPTAVSTTAAVIGRSGMSAAAGCAVVRGAVTATASTVAWAAVRAAIGRAAAVAASAVARIARAAVARTPIPTAIGRTRAAVAAAGGRVALSRSRVRAAGSPRRTRHARRATIANVAARGRRTRYIVSVPRVVGRSAVGSARRGTSRSIRGIRRPRYIACSRSIRTAAIHGAWVASVVDAGRWTSVVHPTASGGIRTTTVGSRHVGIRLPRGCACWRSHRVPAGCLCAHPALRRRTKLAAHVPGVHRVLHHRIALRAI